MTFLNSSGDSIAFASSANAERVAANGSTSLMSLSANRLSEKRFSVLLEVICVCEGGSVGPFGNSRTSTTSPSVSRQPPRNGEYYSVIRLYLSHSPYAVRMVGTRSSTQINMRAQETTCWKLGYERPLTINGNGQSHGQAARSSTTLASLFRFVCEATHKSR